MSKTENIQMENRLLAALPHSEYARLREHLTRVILGPKQVLFEPGERFDSIYFPTGAVISFFAAPAGGRQVAVYLAGKEGVVGLPLVLRIEHAPLRALVQVPGDAWRLSAQFFKEELERAGVLKEILLRYSGLLFTRLIQCVVCASSHPLHKRCARWLLMLHDRVRADQFSLTQQDLADMLGVRRASVTEIAGALRKKGLIQYKRGQITIRDHQALEAAACECYRSDRLET
jgi:CRP-like cAMP-binding protein